MIKAGPKPNQSVTRYVTRDALVKRSHAARQKAYRQRAKRRQTAARRDGLSAQMLGHMGMGA